MTGDDKGNLFFIFYKISLEDFKLSDFLNAYKETLKDEFLKNNIFVYEMDFTMDLSCGFDSKKVRNHLIQNHNFIYEGYINKNFILCIIY